MTSMAEIWLAVIAVSVLVMAVTQIITIRAALQMARRLDRMFGDMAARIDETLDVAKAFIQGPARSGMALVSGIQAAVSAFQGIREASRRRRTTRAAGGDEDESLFIG